MFLCVVVCCCVLGAVCEQVLRGGGGGWLLGRECHLGPKKVMPMSMPMPMYVLCNMPCNM